MPPPAAVQLGSNDCFAGGISPSQLGQPPPLHGGLPAGCWSAAQLPVPAPDPVLWLRPDELKGYKPKQLITSWPDASAYAHDASVDLGFEPSAVLTVDGNIVPGLTNVWQVSSVLPVILAGDFAAYMVVVPTADAHGSVSGLWLADAVIPLGATPLSFETGRLIYSGTVDLASIPYIPTLNSRVLLSVVRTGNAVVFRINGTQFAPQLLAVVDTFTSPVVVPGFFGFPRLTPQQYLELRVYDGTVSPSQDTSIVNSLNTRYNLF